jgi:S-formylglutathione hydrolase FrmB
MRSRTLLAALACLVAAAPATADDRVRITGEQPVDDGHGIELTVETPAFSRPAKVRVYLPAGYDAQPGRRWPVTYYLHGAQGDQARFWSWYGDLIADFPSIVVAPDGGWLGWWSDWYDGRALYETFVVDQLVPLIDERFRTAGTRAQRAIVGESMGGFGVMSIAARNPDAFATAVSMSGAVDNDSLPLIALQSVSSTVQAGGQWQQLALPNGVFGDRLTQEVRWHGHNPADLAGNLGGVELQVRTFEGAPNPIVQGSPDSAAACATENEAHRDSVSFHGRLEAAGIPHVWKDYGAGCHGIPEFRQELADSLPGVEDVFVHPTHAPKAVTYRSIEPRFSVWGWDVAADPARATEFLELRDAGRHGLTLVGSGLTEVTTPPFFEDAGPVDVAGPDGTQSVTPDADGRLRFTVDLGAPHPDQQDTVQSRLAGDGAPGYFTERTVTLTAR